MKKHKQSYTINENNKQEKVKTKVKKNLFDITFGQFIQTCLSSNCRDCPFKDTIVLCDELRIILTEHTFWKIEVEVKENEKI